MILIEVQGCVCSKRADSLIFDVLCVAPLNSSSWCIITVQKLFDDEISAQKLPFLSLSLSLSLLSCAFAELMSECLQRDTLHLY